MSKQTAVLIPSAHIERRILLLRGQKVLLDFDLAPLYGVATKVLNQAVKRNLARFPGDFMFRLTWDEIAQIPRSQTVTLESGRNVKHLPYAFTEQGVAMLASVLRSPRAVLVNIAIMRTFVQLRQMLASNADLDRKFSALEAKYDEQFKVVFDAIRELMSKPEPIRPEHGREIGFQSTPQPREEAVLKRRKVLR